MCQPSLFPWVVTWRDGGRSGVEAWPTEAAAELYATAVLATGSVLVAVTVWRDGARWAEYRWRVRKVSRRGKQPEGV